MKSVLFLCLILTGILFGTTSCQDKTEVTNATIDSLKLVGGIPATNTPQVIDTSLAVYQDTLFPPAGDYGSRTFFNLKNGLVYTGATINQKTALSSDIIMAYFYHNNADTAGTLTNLYTFPYPQKNWKKTMTYFRRGISEEAYNYSNTNSDLKTAFNNSDNAEPGMGAVHNVTDNDIIAFKTENNKYGLIKVKHLVPGNDPYKSFISFEMKAMK